jgi:5'-nucleotidase
VPLDPTASYGLTLNSFMTGGGDNFSVLTEGTDRVIGRVDLDALIAHIESLPQPFGATLEGRIPDLPDPYP